MGFIDGATFNLVAKCQMKFSFFSSTQTATTTELATGRTIFDGQRTEAERVALTSLLYLLLERLPQSNHLQQNVEQLLRTILDATDNLRFIWVGMREVRGSPVAPLAIEGDYVGNDADWSLPESCFDFNAPYSQASLEGIGAAPNFHSLFAPWRGHPESCSANSALAIPLRSERSGVRGLMVFYAADIDYFAHLGIAPFRAFCHLVEVMWQHANMLQLLVQKTQVDPLTGLMNRRKTVLALTKAMEHAERTDTPFSILLCRIEGFDKLTDIYGWFDADQILAAFVKSVGSQMGTEVQAGRWTGVEFIYLLTARDRAAALVAANTLQVYLQTQTIHVQNWSIRLTVNIGVATLSPQSNGLDDLIFQANQHLLSQVV